MKAGLALVLCLICATALLAQLSSTAAPATGAAQAYSLIPALDKSVMDTASRPVRRFLSVRLWQLEQDFVPFPATRQTPISSYNLDQSNRQVLRGILQKAARPIQSRDAICAKIGDYYASCIDDGAIQQKGLPALVGRNWTGSTRSPARINCRNCWRISTDQCECFSGIRLAAGFQGRDARRSRRPRKADSGFPEKDYCLRTGAKDEGDARAVWPAHRQHAEAARARRKTRPPRSGQAIMKLETALAKVSLDVTQQREPHNVYHVMPNQGFAGAHSRVELGSHLYSASGAPAFAEINVAEPEFFKGMNQVIRETDLATIKAYLRWRLVSPLPGTILPKALDEEKFDFDGRKLVGTPEQEARWKRCVRSTDGALPEALGKAYVDQQFPASSKEKSRADDSRHRSRHGSRPWFAGLDEPGDQSSARKEKLHLIANKVGYPDKWRDYSTTGDRARRRFRQQSARDGVRDRGGNWRRSASRWTAMSGSRPRLR